MKTDQIVAHGHAVIKQPLAYMGKSEHSLTIYALPLVFSFFCQKHIYLLFTISPNLLTMCVVAVAGLTG